MKHFLTLTFSLMSILTMAQNVGIGTTTPKARLHVSDSAVLFLGGFSTTLPANPGIWPVSGSGVRMMWLRQHVQLSGTRGMLIFLINHT